MPSGDGTGPLGRGQLTGRGMGYCAGYDQPGFASGGYGGGAGRGFARGGGRGWRNVFRATGLRRWQRAAPVARPRVQVGRTDDVAALKEQANELARSLEDINQRIADLGE